MTITAAPTSITAGRLAERIARDEPLTILDVRPDAGWAIDGPSVTRVHTPVNQALADPAALAAELAGPVTVLCNRGISAQPVAEALRAHGTEATVLEGGMRGWIAVLQARPVELGVNGLAVHQVQRPGRGCLSYVVVVGERALVVDPAPDAGYYEELAATLGAQVTDVVDTHLHADHLSGARELSERTGAALRLPAAALERGVAFADRVRPLRDGDRIDLDGVTVRAIALPGHTTDMTGLLVADRALIAGDSLFADGIARPDLENSDPEGARRMARTLHQTLHERVLALGDDIVLLPGHTHPGVSADAVAPTLAQVSATVGELSIADADEFAERLVSAMPPRPANYETVIAVNSGRHPFDPELETGANSCASR